jgi:hypothetical protein
LEFLSVFLRRGPELQNLGYIMNAQENSRGMATDTAQSASVEQHGASADTWKLVSDLEIIEGTVLGQDVFQQLAQPGNIPLVVANVVNQPPFGLHWLNFECSVKRLISRIDSQVGTQDDQRVEGRADDTFGIVPLTGEGLLVELEVIDLDQHQHRAFHFVVERQVGAHPQ